MSNARIQFSLASEDVWDAYNPQLKEGEIVTVLKANKKVKLVQGKVGGSTYCESTVIWDEDEAQIIMSRSEAAASTSTTQAAAASGSASKAAASQSAAATSATNAKASENAAKTSETNAKSSETAARNSATSAASSASTASTQAGKAADSAAAAAGSAAQAGTFATTATDKATAADKSATAADKRATAAAASAVTASDKASEAATSATNAAVSATSAAGAAEEAQGLISKAEYGFLERNKKYAVGDIAYTTQLPAGYYLECVTAGTTSNTEPSISVESENVNDGTVKWGVKNIQDASKLGLPVGFEAFTTNPNLQAGWLPLLGGEYSRTAYADLWAWVQIQSGYLLEESAWQAKAAANSGNVPFYSKGNGSTTFRVPSLKCWVKGANGIEEVGSYLSAGLPILPDMSHTHERGTMNITGEITYITAEESNISNSEFPTTGAFRWRNESYTQKTYTTSGGGSRDLSFDASRSWTGETSSASLTRTTDIYGNSDTVQPKSIVGMWLVKAYGTVTNVGSTDVAAIAQGLTRVENKLNEAAIVGTVIPYAGTSLPTGYLPCNGAAISRETYASLFAVIGETYGSGDGSTTFNLPNLTDRFIQGSSAAGEYREAGLPNITGESALGEWGNPAGAFYNQGILKTAFLDDGTTGRLCFDASRSNPIYGNSTTVQPPALTMRYIIKY